MKERIIAQVTRKLQAQNRILVSANTSNKVTRRACANTLALVCVLLSRSSLSNTYTSFKTMEKHADGFYVAPGMYIGKLRKVQALMSD